MTDHKSKVESSSLEVKNQHTLGPLRVAQYSTGLNIEASNGQTVCFFTVNRSDEGPLADALRGLACQFAAAPDLLAALQEAESLVIGWAVHHAIQGCATPAEYAKASDISGWHPTHRAIYEKVRAAIRRATEGQ